MIEFYGHDWDELGHRVAEAGIDAYPVEVLELAHVAQEQGVSQLLVDVLVDPAEPEVSRLRAMGLLLRALAASDRSVRRPGPAVGQPTPDVPLALATP